MKITYKKQISNLKDLFIIDEPEHKVSPEKSKIWFENLMRSRFHNQDLAGYQLIKPIMILSRMTKDE